MEGGKGRLVGRDFLETSLMDCADGQMLLAGSTIKSAGLVN